MAYFSVFTSDSVSSDTGTEVGDDPCSTMDALTSLHVPMKSSLKTYQDVGDAQESVFMVPVRRRDQKLILFERIESELMSHKLRKRERISSVLSL